MMWEDVHDVLHVGSMVKLYTSIMPIIFFNPLSHIWTLSFESIYFYPKYIFNINSFLIYWCANEITYIYIVTVTTKNTYLVTHNN